MMEIGGSSKTESGSSKTAGSRTTKDKLNISDEGTAKIIEDLLSGSGGRGLASIFAGEQSAGIFNSSVAAQEAGNFAANVVGEIAKLTAERETTEDINSKTSTHGNSVAAGFKIG